MAVFTRPRRVLALGAGLAALVVVAGIAVQPHPSKPPPPPPVPSDAAAASFLDAAARSREGTWAVTERTTRSFVGGKEILSSTTRRVQRPPDLLVFGNGVVDRVLGGVETTCTADPDDSRQLDCRTGAAAPGASAAAAVNGDLTALRALVSGTAPLYSVAVDATGCFVLAVRTITALAPPYGRNATLCFDRASGAPTRSTVIKDGAESGDDVVDQTIAVEVSAAVTDADLALPQGTVDQTVAPGITGTDPGPAVAEATSTTVRYTDNP